MSLPALTSRLDAVNIILSASGENPVSALNNTTADAANADSILEEVLRDVQSVGFHFNTENDFPLTPDNDGKIILPSNVAKVDVDSWEFPDVDVVQRGSNLYDKVSHSFVFTKPLKAEVVFILPFEDLPEQARRYIAVRAARIFHDRFVGSEVEHKFTADDELQARTNLNKSNLENADPNIFRDNPTFAWRLARR